MGAFTINGTSNGVESVSLDANDASRVLVVVRNLKPGDYHFQIAANTLEDLAGNVFAGAPNAGNIKVDLVAPTLIADSDVFYANIENVRCAIKFSENIAFIGGVADLSKFYAGA